MLKETNFDLIFYRYYNDDLQHLGDNACIKHYSLYGKIEGRCVNIKDALRILGYKQYIDIEIYNLINLNNLKKLNLDIPGRWLNSKELFLYWFIAFDTKNERTVDCVVDKSSCKIAILNKKEMELKYMDLSDTDFNYCIKKNINQDFLSWLNKKIFINFQGKDFIENNVYFTNNAMPATNLNKYADMNPDLKIKFGSKKYKYVEHFDLEGKKQRRDSILYGRSLYFSGKSDIQEVFEKNYQLIASKLSLSTIDDKLLFFSGKILNDYPEYDQFIVALLQTIEMLITQLYLRRTTQLIIVTKKYYIFTIALYLINDSFFNSFHTGGDAAINNITFLKNKQFLKVNILSNCENGCQDKINTDRLIIFDQLDYLAPDAALYFNELCKNDKNNWENALIVVHNKSFDGIDSFLKELPFDNLVLTTKFISKVKGYKLTIFGIN